MICDSLLKPPKQCLTFSKSDPVVSVEDSTSVWLTVLITLGAMTVGFVVALLVYTKIIRKEVDQQLSLEVNKMV